MRYPTDAGIAEMKSRGHDPETVRQAVQMKELGEEASEVIQIIEAAFGDVKLGNGTGLWEAQGLDDYADASTCARYREQDEKDDWRRISPEMLLRCHSSLSFFNAEGMRFHLPAFLIADLRGDLGIGMDFCLTHHALADHPTFSLLSPEQRLGIRMYLLHIMHHPDYQFSKPDIQCALDQYWVWPQELRSNSGEASNAAADAVTPQGQITSHHPSSGLGGLFGGRK
ncbi:MAG: hypothetical protein HS117_03905 [Verrucomicrobiaceae bacterium]|nr:hypothetical protein [Verrucomicrobiaceae bacterium]